jgi:hypothetical protein
VEPINRTATGRRRRSTPASFQAQINKVFESHSRWLSVRAFAAQIEVAMPAFKLSTLTGKHAARDCDLVVIDDE